MITTPTAAAAPSRALQQILPADIDMQVAVDRTITIRASLAEVERTVLIAVVLVIGVVAFFLRNGRAVLISPASLSPCRSWAPWG